MKKKSSDVKQAELKTHIKMWPKAVIFACLLIIFIVGVGALGAWVYKDRAFPNVTVGSLAVSNQTREKIIEIVKQQEAEIKINFVEGGKTTTVPAKDLGIAVDAGATANAALAAVRLSSPLDALQAWQPRTVPLVLQNDPGILMKYVAQQYPKLFVDAKEPQLNYNEASQQFELRPGVNGSGFDIKKFQAALPEIAKKPGTITIEPTSAPTLPIISDEAAAKAQTEVNTRLKLQFKFILDGREAYVAQPSDIAKWVRFVPDAGKGAFTVEYDKTTIGQFINDKVAPTVTRTPIDRKVVVDKDTGAQTVIVAGRTGWGIKDADILSGAIATALQENRELRQDIAITEAPFKTITMAGTGKWIEVDLSQQRLTAYIGNTVVGSYLISSGTARTPTQIGQGAIYAKYPVQTMSGTIAGDYFYVPNVRWVNYFNGGEAIHGTYWHNNFGRPMSHGCINMTEADAKFIYDFAPIGTKVVVHP